MALLFCLSFIIGYFNLEKAFALRDEFFTTFFEEIENDDVVDIDFKVKEIEFKYDKYYIKGIVLDHRYKDILGAKLLILSDNDNDLYIGDNISVKGVIKNFDKKRNFGNFDREDYYKSVNVISSIKAETIIKNNKNSNYIYKKISKLREKFNNNIDLIFDSEKASLLKAMLVGEDFFITQDYKELYKTAGLSHLIAISGLHLMFIAMFLYAILKRFLSLYVSMFFVLSILMMFSFFVGNSVSVKRALYMFVLKIIADFLGRHFDAITAIMLVSLLLIIENPFIITNTSFLLSVAGITSVIIVYNILYEKIKAYKTLLLSFSVVLITNPIIGYFFYEIAFYAAIANLAVIPFASIVIMFGYTCIILSFINYKFGIFIAGIVNVLLEFFEFICRLIDSLLNSTIITGKINLIELFLYYIAVIVFLKLIITANKKHLKIILFSLFMLCITINFRNNIFIFIDSFKTKELEITLLDVGQGESIHISTPNSKNIFIDAGSTNINDVAKIRVLPYLKAKGITKIDYFFISHFDLDHISGILEMLQDDSAIIIKNIMIYNDYDTTDKEYILLQKKVEGNKNTKLIYIDDSFYFKEEGLSINCIHPKKSEDEKKVELDENDNSLVLTLKYYEFTALFTGDIGKKTEEYLVEKKALDEFFTNNYTLVKSSHHGSKNSNSSLYLEYIKPKIAIISAGVDNVYNHPHKDTINTYDDLKIKYFNTANNGAIRIMTDGLSYKVETFLKNN